jgi:poly-gamma-glutamate synthesis protein (capsule biosynthesis protein)
MEDSGRERRVSCALDAAITRRRALLLLGAVAAGGLTGCDRRGSDEPARTATRSATPQPTGDTVTLFLCGDVMTGRGIDQVMQHQSNPQLYESHVQDASEYVRLAEYVSGPIPKSVEPAYIWGDALGELDRVAPAARIINLETSITTSTEPAPDKGIHYKMHPANVSCLTAAKIDCCALANNHVLDWGRAGLEETLSTLRTAGVETAGAGRNIEQARVPAIIGLKGGGRVLVFSFGTWTSGIAGDWAAGKSSAGVDLLRDLDTASAREIGERVRRFRKLNDIVVASIHWGGNWGYRVPREQRAFAHALIDEAGVDVVHGHSSHHPKPIEIYNGKLVLYGCGDFVNDYEGIGGHVKYRGELALMYFVGLDRGSNSLARVELTPMRMRRFRLQRGTRNEAQWLHAMLARESKSFGTRIELTRDHALILRGA